MRGNDVLSKLVDGYAAANPDISKEILDGFYAHSLEWFRTNGVVGVGHTSDGISLRFADGSDRLLYASSPATMSASVTEVAHSITTGKEGLVKKPVLGDQPSVQITGR